MQSFSMARLDAHRLLDGRPYLEFLREDSLSVGLYALPAGGVDRQSPHGEDEVYVVMAGLARFTVGDETEAVGAGDKLFVAAGVPHHFHDITEALKLIVVFAPPEGSAAEAASGLIPGA